MVETPFAKEIEQVKEIAEASEAKMRARTIAQYLLCWTIE
jgi:hypothetical protein